MYVVKKILDENYSCAFRQPNAVGTHCDKIHGYSLAFEPIIQCESLDDRNWVFSFGDFKELKDYLKANFDHKTAIAEYDPELSYFQDGHNRGVLDLNILPHVGCEAFARQTCLWFYKWMDNENRKRKDGRYVQVIGMNVYERYPNNMAGFML